MGHTSSWFDPPCLCVLRRCEWFAWPPPQRYDLLVRALAPFREEASGCLRMPSCFVQCSKLKTTTQRNKRQQQQKTGKGRKTLPLVEVGWDRPPQHRWGVSDWLLSTAQHSGWGFSCLKKKGRTRLNQSLPLCGQCKHLFAYWQLKLSHLQTQHSMCVEERCLWVYRERIFTTYVSGSSSFSSQLVLCLAQVAGCAVGRHFLPGHGQPSS